MLLRHAKDHEFVSAENTFEAIDDKNGKVVCSCAIYTAENSELFPLRPFRIYLELNGSQIPDALLGAAVARAKEIARDANLPARIFTMIEPDDCEALQSLTDFGFKDNDGLIRMKRGCAKLCEENLPVGCVLVRDLLDDPMEQKFFLERYNRQFAEENDTEWLKQLINTEGFERILIVSPTGMAAEALINEENGIGSVIWLYTSKKWRGRGVAGTALNIACNEFNMHGIHTAHMDVQAKVPHLVSILERAGFAQSELLCRYPGMDIDPE